MAPLPIHPILDLLLKMPLYLDIQSIGRIAQTCRDALQRSYADEVWRPRILTILRRYPPLELEFTKIPPRENRLRHIYESCINPFTSANRCIDAMRHPDYLYDSCQYESDLELEYLLGQHEMEGVCAETKVVLSILRMLITDFLRRVIDKRIDVISCFRAGRSQGDLWWWYTGCAIIRIVPGSLNDPYWLKLLDHAPIIVDMYRTFEYDPHFEYQYDPSKECRIAVNFRIGWKEDFYLCRE